MEAALLGAPLGECLSRTGWAAGTPLRDGIAYVYRPAAVLVGRTAAGPRRARHLQPWLLPLAGFAGAAGLVSQLHASSPTDLGVIVS